MLFLRFVDDEKWFAGNISNHACAVLLIDPMWDPRLGFGMLKYCRSSRIMPGRESCGPESWSHGPCIWFWKMQHEKSFQSCKENAVRGAGRTAIASPSSNEPMVRMLADAPNWEESLGENLLKANMFLFKAIDYSSPRTKKMKLPTPSVIQTTKFTKNCTLHFQHAGNTSWCDRCRGCWPWPPWIAVSKNMHFQIFITRNLKKQLGKVRLNKDKVLSNWMPLRRFSRPSWVAEFWHRMSRRRHLSWTVQTQHAQSNAQKKQSDKWYWTQSSCRTLQILNSWEHLKQSLLMLSVGLFDFQQDCINPGIFGLRWWLRKVDSTRQLFGHIEHGHWPLLCPSRLEQLERPIVGVNIFNQ